MRSLWQKVVAEGKKALDSDRILETGKSAVSSLQKLLCALEECSADEEVDLPKEGGHLIQACLATDPHCCAAELGKMTDNQAAVDTATELTETLEKLKSFLSPQRLLRNLNGIKEWIENLWVVVGEGPPAALCSDDAGSLQVPWEGHFADSFCYSPAIELHCSSSACCPTFVFPGQSELAGWVTTDCS